MELVNIMDTNFRILRHTNLFKGFSQEEIEKTAVRIHFSFQEYAENQIIAQEEDECQKLGIVLSGSIHVQRNYAVSKSITIDTLQRFDTFGEAIMFSDAGHYPATLIAVEETLVAYLNREAVIQLCSESPQFMKNFLRQLSNKILMLNQKIKSISYPSIRQKIAHFILAEYTRQGKNPLDMKYSRKEMAEYLGIPRPSLSREMILMREDRILDFDRNFLTILSMEQIEASLKN